MCSSCKDDMKILQDLRFQPSTYRVNGHLDDKLELLSGLQTFVFSAIFILEIVVLVTNVVTLFYSQRGGCQKYILNTHSHVLAYKWVDVVKTIVVFIVNLNKILHVPNLFFANKLTTNVPII